MACGCNNKNSGNNTMKAYRNKHRNTTKIHFNKPSKTKEQLRQELIERMNKATGK